MKYVLLLATVYIIILFIFYYVFSNDIDNIQPLIKESFKNRKTKVKYTYKGYKSLLKSYSNIKYTTAGIPKIIFKTSWQKRSNFPSELTMTLNNTIIMNPDYNLYYFDDNEVIDFMESYSSRAYKAYMKIIPGAYKADLFRYCILEKYGGCYSDIGHITYEPFDKICENNKLVLVKDLGDNGIHNALLCTVPHHPFIQKLVESCITNIESNYYGYSSLSITGPVLVGNIFYRFYHNSLELVSLTDNKNSSFQKENDKIMFRKYIIPGTENGIKILQLYSIGEEKDTNDNKYIIDINKNILIRTKFDNYYKIMYSKQPYYNYFWKNNKVYN